MDKEPYFEQDDEQKIEIVDIEPAAIDTGWQRGVMNVQRTWLRSRRVRLAGTVASALALLALVLPGLLRPFLQQQHSQVVPIAKPVANLLYAQVFPWQKALYIFTLSQQNTGSLEAVDARTGVALWSYTRSDVGRVALIDGELYVTARAGLFVSDASTRALLWRHAPLSEGWLVDNGVLVTGVGSGIDALNTKDGTLLWHRDALTLTGQIDNGVVYVQAQGHRDIEALNVKDGSLLWRRADSTSVQPWQVSDGMLYVSLSGSHSLQAFNGRSGSLLWQKHVGEDFHILPQNSIVLLFSEKSGGVQALNSKDGSLLWRNEEAAPNSTFTFIPEQHDLVTMMLPDDSASAVLHLNDGSPFWRYNRPGYIFYIQDDMGYVTTQARDISAIRIHDGSLAWRYKQPGWILLVNAGLFAVVSPNTGILTALRAHDGTMLWRHKLLVSN